MIMLATTAAGDAYTFSELQGMAADAGFRSSELYRLDHGAAVRGRIHQVAGWPRP